MGETRVDLLHLLEDLRDAYPGAVEETILTEIMANALDSGASTISFGCDPAERALTAIDNGSGMQRGDLARFHDIASSNKIRGQGIGFAGVGIKLGLLICEEVLTETRRGKTHVASAWHMASRHRAPWKWVPPAGRVQERGTAVRLRLRNPLSPLLDPGFLEASLRRHFQPLLDPAFTDFLNLHYANGIVINVNQQRLTKQHSMAPLQAPLEIRLLRKRKPSAVGYLFREDKSLPEDQRGVAISTFGKLSSLVEQRAGGQKRLPLGNRGSIADGRSFVAASLTAIHEREGDQPRGDGAAASRAETPAVNEPAATFTVLEHAVQLPSKSTARRPAHYGLDIQFEDRSDDLNLGRLVESTIWVNRAHPAYRRALASHSIGYHIALTVAMALAPLAVEPAQQSTFVLTFLARWGEVLDKPAVRKRASQR